MTLKNAITPFLLVIFIPVSLFAKTPGLQAEFAIFKRQVLLNEKCIDKWKIVPRLHQDDLYVLYSDLNHLKDNISYMPMFKYDSLGRETELKVLFPQKSVGSQEKIKDFCFQNDTLFILGEDLYVFLRNGQNFLFRQKTAHNSSAEKIHIYKGDLYLPSVQYKSDTSANTRLLHYHTKTAAFSNCVYEDPEGVEFAMVRPRRIFDFYTGKTLLADADRYRIAFFDENNNLCDSIVYMPEMWRESEPSYLPYPRDLEPVTYYVRNEARKASLIRKAAFLDSNTIWVQWTEPPPNWLNRAVIIHHDIWKKRKGRWKIIREDAAFPLPDDVTQFNLFMYVNEYFLMGGENFCFFAEIPFILTPEHFGKSSFEMEYAIEQAWQKEKRYSIFLWQFK